MQFYWSFTTTLPLICFLDKAIFVFRQILLALNSDVVKFTYGHRSFRKLVAKGNGVAMGSPLDTSPAEIFMCSFENKWLKDCPRGLKNIYHQNIPT